MSIPTLSLVPQESCGHEALVIQPPIDLVLRGEFQIPGDKSISHRALMLGAIARGETHIKGLLLGEDPQSTAACLRAMGAQISNLNADLVQVQGLGGGTGSAAKPDHLQVPSSLSPGKILYSPSGLIY